MTKIDAFAHILPPSYAERLESLTAGQAVSERILGYRPWIREDPALIDLDARWRTIEPFGDYKQVLTLAVPPLEELADAATALDLARAANDELAGLVGRHPDRFAGFTAALPMGDPQAAAGELDRAMGQLGALGAQLHTNVRGTPLDEPGLDVIFEVVTGRRGALWLHPTRSPAWPDYPAEKMSKYGIWWSLGWPYETSVAMARLVYSGCFDRHPDLTVIAHRAGAMVPHFAGRLAAPLEVSASRGIFAMARDRRIPAVLARTSRRHGSPLGATIFLVGAAVATLAVNQFWTGLFALPGLPHYFALFAWGSTFGGFALVVVYLLMSLGALRNFGRADGKVQLIIAAVIGIAITGGAIFGSFYKVTRPTIWAPWFALVLLVIGLGSTWILRPREAASTRLADLSSAAGPGERPVSAG